MYEKKVNRENEGTRSQFEIFVWCNQLTGTPIAHDMITAINV